MSPEDIGNLTIAEVEAINLRATEALQKFNEARAALGAVVQTSAPLAPPVALRVAGRPMRQNPTLTDDEIAERERLVAANRGPPGEPADELPADIANMLRGG